MLWTALLPSVAPEPSRRTEATADALQGLSYWCLGFTPRVALVEPLSESPAVVMDVAASTRLFGGKRRLVERVNDEARAVGAAQVAWAPTSLGAVALARSGLSNGFARPLPQTLDGLPVQSLTAVSAHQTILARMGCHTLGEVRALPRGGLSRRFDAEVLLALDRAYGLRPEAHDWVVLPETFSAKLELMSRVEVAPAILFGARRLLLQMTGWLAARQSGVTAFKLRWFHDAMRAKSAGDSGELTVGTAQPTRDVEHLTRLLAEHLAKVTLLAPVGDLELFAEDVQVQEEKSLTLFPEPQRAGESLALVLERVAARLGPERVLRPVIKPDYRPEWMCHWQPASTARPKPPACLLDVPQPSFIFPEPLRLAMRGHRPLYQGVLQLLAGPHRTEGGWWDRVEAAGREETRNVARDYWVALSAHAGVLWVFQTRLTNDEAAWFLHGVFA